jgi:hypothetical protein
VKLFIIILYFCTEKYVLLLTLIFQKYNYHVNSEKTVLVWNFADIFSALETNDNTASCTRIRMVGATSIKNLFACRFSS